MNNNPITLIKEDHENVERLFREYEVLGDQAFEDKQKIADALTAELSIHAEMEEGVCYPRFKEALSGEGENLIEEAYVEHQSVKNLLQELAALEPNMPEFDACIKAIMEEVRHHVREEEDELLPLIEEKMTEDELATLTEDIKAYKEVNSTVRL